MALNSSNMAATSYGASNQLHRFPKFKLLGLDRNAPVAALLYTEETWDGLGRNAPFAAFMGDMGWHPIFIITQMLCISFFLRLNEML